MSRITGLRVRDVRFPTSRDHDGSDAMNPAPDYSAAYVEISTDALDGHVGTGFVFTIGRGNEVQEAAIAALRDHVLGADSEALLDDMGGNWRALVPTPMRRAAETTTRRSRRSEMCVALLLPVSHMRRPSAVDDASARR